MNIPKHVAIILDGNGRWAKQHGKPRTFGHVQGAKTVEDMCEITYNMGIQYFTVYAFSTENWSRPDEEVSALMKLLRNYMINCKKRANQNNMCVRVIGDKTGLDADIQEKIADLEEATKNNTGLHFQIAINYGGRAEIAHAFNKLLIEGKTEVTESDISSAIYTSESPDPDIIVRTGGDMRISNFLLWQSAYSELYFTDTLWPDMKPEDVDAAVAEFYSRKRRFGGL